jgi:hypothetical protein
VDRWLESCGRGKTLKIRGARDRLTWIKNLLYEVEGKNSVVKLLIAILFTLDNRYQIITIEDPKNTKNLVFTELNAPNHPQVMLEMFQTETSVNQISKAVFQIPDLTIISDFYSLQ